MGGGEEWGGEDSKAGDNGERGLLTVCVCEICRPPDPLRVLGEFLLGRSKELEGGGGGGEG